AAALHVSQFSLSDGPQLLPNPGEQPAITSVRPARFHADPKRQRKRCISTNSLSRVSSSSEAKIDIESLRTWSDAPATFLRPLIIAYKVRLPSGAPTIIWEWASIRRCSQQCMTLSIGSEPARAGRATFREPAIT